MTVGALTHEVALVHDAGRGHPERPDRIRAIRAHLDETGLADRLDWTQPEPAPAETVALAHATDYVDALVRLDEAGGGRLDADTRMGPASLEAALRGSGAAIQAAERVLDGRWTGAVSLMRPPGHHATRSRAMGFCLTNHAAVAARWAVRSGRAARVLIVDWDAHHGNGTEDIFWTDPSVMYVSLHQYPFYPGTGAVTDVGEGDGTGTTMNVPLPAYSGEDVYERAFGEVIIPGAEAFAPELVIVSAGYDAHMRDPLCMMSLRAGAFYRFTKLVAALGPGPVCVLEGGYDLDALAWSMAATVSALVGEPGPVGVPQDEVEPTRGSPDAARWVERAKSVHDALRESGQPRA